MAHGRFVSLDSRTNGLLGPVSRATKKRKKEGGGALCWALVQVVDYRGTSLIRNRPPP